MWFIYVVVFLLALYFLMRKDTTVGKEFTGPIGIPVVGNAFQFSDDTMHVKLSEWAYQHGPIYCISVFGQRLIILNNEENIRKAMSTQEFRDIFSGRQATFYGDYFLFGSQSIAFTNDLSLHQKLRKAFTKGLHVYGEGIQAFEDIITKQITKTVNVMRTFEGQDFDPTVLVKAALSNVISVLMNGKPLNNSEKADDMFWKFTEINDAVLNTRLSLVASTFPFLRHVPGYLNRLCSQLDKSKDSFTLEYVKKMKETYDPTKVRGFIDYLIQSQLDDIRKGQDVLFTDERILCMVTETVATGLNTSVSTLCSIILCMIHDPRCQDRMYREIMQVIGPDRAPTLSDRTNMPYTEAVLQESLRYAPPGPLGMPHLCNNDVIFEGHNIKAGDLVVMNLWHVLHDKEIYEDPFVFRPERFLDETGQMVPPNHELRKHWIPFGIGRRQCIGEGLARSRIFLLIATLFQHYRFLPPEKGNIISSDPRTYRVGIVLHPKDFTCRIQPRFAD